MKQHGLNEKQIVELSDSVGKLLVMELEAPAVKTKVKKMVSDYVKKNKIDTDPSALSEKLHWHVQVLLKK